MHYKHENLFLAVVMFRRIVGIHFSKEWGRHLKNRPAGRLRHLFICISVTCLARFICNCTFMSGSSANLSPNDILFLSCWLHMFTSLVVHICLVWFANTRRQNPEHSLFSQKVFTVKFLFRTWLFFFFFYSFDPYDIHSPTFQIIAYS